MVETFKLGVAMSGQGLVRIEVSPSRFPHFRATNGIARRSNVPVNISSA